MQDAAIYLGCDFVAAGGRDALALLAQAAPQYSHLLVDSADAEGMFDELAELATEVKYPGTDMLVLGAKAEAGRQIRSILQATAGSVIEALVADRAPRNCQDIDLGEIEAALAGSWIDARYQPIVRFADRRPVGLEALARLNHPKQGTLSPDRFLPLLEKSGLARRLTELVARRAFHDMAGGAFGEPSLSVSVNFPLDVLLQPESLEVLDAQRGAAGIESSQVIVELTESRPVSDFVTLGRALESLRMLGYRVAIDDVGPAVPRLQPLLDLPFTSLKLDKDVVQQVNASPDAFTFLQDTINAAKAHGLYVVAEGIENAEIWAAMSALGADEAQGFLAARPLPPAAVTVWLDRWTSRAAI
ncbi:MAG TPA: EAL domain-containing protein [Rhodopila sp.]|nr:EAL domain-containing protein [Rhodopila sp.]